MYKKDLLSPWLPIQQANSELFVESLCDNESGLQITLVDANSGIKTIIVFNNYISYRNTKESYLLKTWHLNDKSMLGKTLYIIENSSYIDYLKEMSMGFHPDLTTKCKHYAIYTVDDCLDIIATETPECNKLSG